MRRKYYKKMMIEKVYIGVIKGLSQKPEGEEDKENNS
jgi:hypothetical protein